MYITLSFRLLRTRCKKKLNTVINWTHQTSVLGLKSAKLTTTPTSCLLTFAIDVQADSYWEGLTKHSVLLSLAQELRQSLQVSRHVSKRNDPFKAHQQQQANISWILTCADSLR
mmetsp:Transcript_47826/g.150013  ORF Transcript_47826/g.150013 Transcript_47826/m.150013 type:complete len:114 (+) Transcript_47826:113-454(+)